MGASNICGSEIGRADADSLAATIEGCRQGDRSAQRRLYDSCHEKVFRLAVRMVGSQDAPDVTQNVFLQLFRKIDQYAGHARFETWLYRLSVNEALQFLRKQARWRFQTILDEPMSRERHENERDEAREVLDQALARLEPELRSIFLLREVEELSYREIAEATGIPEGTVGSRLNRARRELRRHLTDLGWEPTEL